MVGGEALQTLLALVRFVLGGWGQLRQQVLHRQDITGAVEFRRGPRHRAQVPHVLDLHPDSGKVNREWGTPKGPMINAVYNEGFTTRKKSLLNLK